MLQTVYGDWWSQWRRDRLLLMRRTAAVVSLLMLLLWSLATVLLTLLPGESIQPQVSRAIAKLGHVVLFGGWALLAGLSVVALRGMQRLNLRLLWIAAVTFGAIIEILQTALPFSREGSLLDVVINAVGVSAACLVLRRIRKNCVASAPLRHQKPQTVTRSTA